MSAVEAMVRRAEADSDTAVYLDGHPFFVRVPFPRTNAASSRPSPAVELAAPRPSRPTAGPRKP